MGNAYAGPSVPLPRALVAAAFAPVVGVSFGVVGALLLVVAMAGLSLAITALGTAVGSRMRTFEGFGVVSNFVVLPLYFLSGGGFPPEGLPAWMRALVLLNPVSYCVDPLRAAAGQPHLCSASIAAHD